MNSQILSEDDNSVGARRIADKLTALGINYPESILTRPPQKPSEFPGFTEFPGLSPLENALLDRFVDRDYAMATRLIFGQTTEEDWHTIDIDSTDALPNYLSDCQLFTSLEEAIAVVVQACDKDGVSIDRLEPVSDDGVVQVIIEGKSAVKILPVPFEPYMKENRDRVRSALKHLRDTDPPDQLTSRLRGLPGFAKIKFGEQFIHRRLAGSLLLGFPTNWAGAMRSALAEVGIDVKQHQAQEVAAALFGAASWHQLVQHDHDARSALHPVVTHWRDINGLNRRAFYRTTEEAIFALGKRIVAFSGDLVLDHFDLSLRRSALTVNCRERTSTGELEGPFQTGWEDIGGDPPPSPSLLAAARRIMVALQAGERPANLYGEGDLWQRFVAIQSRRGIPETDLLAIGEYWLALAKGEDHSAHDYLRVFRAHDSKIDEIHGGVALYKAEFRRRPSSDGRAGEVVDLKADYGRQLVASIPIGTPQDIDKLKALLRDRARLGGLNRISA